MSLGSFFLNRICSIISDSYSSEPRGPGHVSQSETERESEFMPQSESRKQNKITIANPLSGLENEGGCEYSRHRIAY